MNDLFKKPFLVFALLVLLMAVIFFTLPINLFDGIVVRENGLQELKLEQNLSLSYFIGIGFDESDMVGIKDFYLTTKGYIIAGIVLLGVPGLLAYRMHIRETMKAENGK